MSLKRFSVPPTFRRLCPDAPTASRKAYILSCVLACLLIFPSFIALKPMVFPELDMSDPNPSDAALQQAARLMAFASLPTAFVIGRYTAYRNRDAGDADSKAYFAAVPVVGSIWMLRLLAKPSVARP